MSITLESVTLPPYLQWEDEFSWQPVEQAVDYLVSGSLEIQESIRLAGRPITLVGDQHRGWITRDVLLALYTLSESPRELALNYHGRTFTTRFNRSSGSPISAVPLVVRIPPGENDKYHSLTIKLMAV